ncbi:MAG TPA: Gfo/Idh/MocA family oxidoreductase [Spirochaetia bacterium]|nr:Gfo/Idh/MocA family oxidoreductase [Spirochaetia bacterium]
MTAYPVGIIGCGDFLRRQAPVIRSSSRIKVTRLFDLDKRRAGHFADVFGGEPADSAEEILSDPSIPIVFIFTPPWARRELAVRATGEGKHIVMAKPLAAHADDADAILEAVRGRVNCAVFYRRTGNPFYETLRRVFDSGEIGRLSLYKEDWLHHYPVWNSWATDPDRNRGPFMDAMIHTLNIARYLMEGEVSSLCFFSQNYAQKLDCVDTEFLKVDFSSGGSAYLFISWAANLEIYDTAGNEREFILNCHMVTDQGWYVSEGRREDRPVVQARNEKSLLTWPFLDLQATAYDGFVEALEAGSPQPFHVEDAWRDVHILEQAMAGANKMIRVKL